MRPGGRETIVMAKRPETVTVEILLFHVFVLPALWLVDIVWLTIIFWGTEGSYAPLILGCVGFWLGFIGASTGSDILALVFNCIGGVLVMALIGFFQDVFRIPKWVVALYPALAVVVLLYAAIYGTGDHGSYGEYVRGVVVCLCPSIYVVSFLSCLFAFGWWSVRKWRRTS